MIILPDYLLYVCVELPAVLLDMEVPCRVWASFIVQNSTTYIICLQDNLFVDAVYAFEKIEMKTCVYLGIRPAFLQIASTEPMS
jgi:hypothetical protein